MSQPAEPNQPHRPYPRVVAYPAKPRRHRPVNPYAAANELAILHQDIADKVAGNLSRRTGHPTEDLRQIAMMGIIQASRRYDPSRGKFRPFARAYANSEVFHYLRDKGFAIKVPPSWREIYARVMKACREGNSLDTAISRIGVNPTRWRQISTACSQRIIALESIGESAFETSDGSDA